MHRKKFSLSIRNDEILEHMSEEAVSKADSSSRSRKNTLSEEATSGADYSSRMNVYASG